jgi:uncharacterized protein YbaR (Trm112 family)
MPELPVPESLLSVLVDPSDRLPLAYFPEQSVFYNPRLKVLYPIVDGIPMLLIASGQLAKPDAVQGLDEAVKTARLTGAN